MIQAILKLTDNKNILYCTCGCLSHDIKDAGIFDIAIIGQLYTAYSNIKPLCGGYPNHKATNINPDYTWPYLINNSININSRPMIV